MRALSAPLLLSLVACNGGAKSDASAPTWHADIAPVLAQHCTSCHMPGGIAPFDMTNYAGAAPMAAAIATAVEAGTMPPWGAQETADCQPRYGWKDDLRLSDDDKAAIRAWADAGAPEGDPADAAPLPTPPELALSDADEHLAPTAPFVTAGDGDQFQCFALGTPLEADQYLSAVQVVPDNHAVVHHVLVFVDNQNASAGLADANGQWDCAGSIGIDDLSLVAAWAPGALPNRVPEGTGMPVPKGSRLFMQIHYHPAGSTGASDATALDVKWLDHKPAHNTTLVLLGNASSAGEGLQADPDDRGQPEFRIPAGADAHHERINLPIMDSPSVTYPVWMVGTHMHYVGTGMRITVHHGTPHADEPTDECFVETPQWNFDWQRGYVYDAPLAEVPQIRGDDVIKLDCGYENTLHNPAVARSLAQAGLSEPHDVSLGESTQDEMCLGVFGIVYDD